MADTTYQPKTYRKQGGDEFVVAASGAITVESSGDIDIESGGQVDIESGGHVDVESGGIVDFQTGAVFKDTSAGGITDRHTFVDTVDWSGAGSTAGAHGSWTAPATTDILITGFYLKIVTQSSEAACKLDVGTTDTSATTLSANLLNSLVATGAGVAGTYNTSTGAPTAIKLTAGKWITASATGTVATALVTKAYIRFVVV